MSAQPFRSKGKSSFLTFTATVFFSHFTFLSYSFRIFRHQQERITCILLVMKVSVQIIVKPAEPSNRGPVNCREFLFDFTLLPAHSRFVSVYSDFLEICLSLFFL